MQAPVAARHACSGRAHAGAYGCKACMHIIGERARRSARLGRALGGGCGGGCIMRAHLLRQHVRRALFPEAFPLLRPPRPAWSHAHQVYSARGVSQCRNPPPVRAHSAVPASKLPACNKAWIGRFCKRYTYSAIAARRSCSAAAAASRCSRSCTSAAFFLSSTCDCDLPYSRASSCCTLSQLVRRM